MDQQAIRDKKTLVSVLRMCIDRRCIVHMQNDEKCSKLYGVIKWGSHSESIMITTSFGNFYLQDEHLQAIRLMGDNFVEISLDTYHWGQDGCDDR